MGGKGGIGPRKFRKRNIPAPYLIPDSLGKIEGWSKGGNFFKNGKLKIFKVGISNLKMRCNFPG